MPGLACPGLRGEIGLPLGQPVAVAPQPALHVRRAAVAHRLAQHRERQAVDLEEENPRRVGVSFETLAPSHALDQPQRVLIVIAGAEQGLEQQGEGGDSQRPEKRGTEGVDADRIREGVAGQLESEGVDDQDREEPGHKREWKSHAPRSAAAAPH